MNDTAEVELAVPPEFPRRLAYLGTPEIAVPPLRALVDAGFDVALVVSRPDRRRGRGGALSPSPVKAAAIDLGLEVTDQLADVRAADVDLGVVVAYGRIIPTSLLIDLAFVNLHFSLLPRWRGAAPVERAILAGDTVSGVCLMGLEPALDTGPIYRVEEVPIGPDETAAELFGELVKVGSRLVVDGLRDGLRDPAPQEGEPTYAEKLERDERHLDLHRSAVELGRVVRIGGAWTSIDGRRLKILRARPAEPVAGAVGELDGTVVATGDGGLELIDVQPEGKGPMAAVDWRRGLRADTDVRLGT